MRPWLFWKILIGSWMVFFTSVEALWLVITLFATPPMPPGMRSAEQIAPVMLASAAAAVREGGLDQLNALMRSWPQELRSSLSVSLGGERAMPVPGPAGDHDATEIVSTPEGTTWRLTYRPLADMPPAPPGLPGVPLPVLALGFAGATLFCAALGWYLRRASRFLRENRSGFDVAGLSLR
jgi:hypothetical protein